MSTKYVFVALFCYIALVIGQQDWQGTFSLTKPGLKGTLTGTIFYSKPNVGIRLNYVSGGYTEIQKYNLGSVQDLVVYRKCSSKCDTVGLSPNTIMPNMYREGSETQGATITTPAGQCTVYTKTVASQPVLSVCVSAGNAIFRVSMKDGSVYDITGFSAVAQASSTFAAPAGCVFTCDTQMDVVLVVDESGSIDGNYIPGQQNNGEWKQIRDFAISFVAPFKIGATKVNMGLVQFGSYGDGARVVAPMLTDQGQVTATINGLTKCISANNCPSQATYTGIGVIKGANLLLDVSGPRAIRATVPKLIVLITDGYDNYGSSTFTIAGRTYSNFIPTGNPADWITYIRSRGITLVAIGVGSDIDDTYLDKLASTLPPPSNKKLYYRVNAFNDLANQEIRTQIGILACTSTGTTNPCGTCAGLCACGSCICPDNCNDGSACTTDVCTATQNSQGGCVHIDIVCNDNNKCTDDSCSAATGCVFTPFNIATRCNDNDPCTLESCTPGIGCFNPPKNCTDPDPCKVGAKCNPSNGVCLPFTNNICIDKNPCTKDVCNTAVPPVCSFVPIDCTRGDKCIVPDCNFTSNNTFNGCSNASVNCDDGNACSTDSCNSVTGCIHTPINCDDNNPCTDDTCDDNLGCVHTPVNATIKCYTGDICANYTCDPAVAGGCVILPLICPNDYNDSCIYTACDNIQGCIPLPVQCNYTGPKPECFVSICNSSASPICQFEETQECNLARILGSTGAAVLGAGVIAAIVIAAVVCAGTTTTLAVLGFNGAFSGEFDNKNPLYEKETKEGVNPLYRKNSKPPK